jgi:hypothetical protein
MRIHKAIPRLSTTILSKLTSISWAKVVTIWLSTGSSSPYTGIRYRQCCPCRFEVAFVFLEPRGDSASERIPHFVYITIAKLGLYDRLVIPIW